MAQSRMSLAHIEAFRMVMATGTMTEASRRLYTSQPQVSRLVAQLEVIAGFSLFDRSGSRLSPTVDGTRFHAEVERSFAGLANLEGAAARIRAFGADRLRLAAMPRLAGGLLSRAVVQFKLAHPDVVVAIHTGGDEVVREWVATGFCDAALTMIYGALPDPCPDEVLSLACVAVLPPGHRLTALNEVEPKDLQGESFVAPAPGTALRTQIDATFAAARVPMTVTAEAGLGSSVCALVAAGIGVSVMNPLAAQEEAQVWPIAVRPFVPLLPVHISLLFPPQRHRSRLLQTFAACANEVLADQERLLSPP